MTFQKPPRSPRRQSPELAWTSFQDRILEQLTELKSKVEESVEQGRQNGEEVRLLRKELGLDGAHGRIPLVEATLERLLERVSALELARIESEGKRKLVTSVLALLSGGAGGALIALLGHALGVR